MSDGVVIAIVASVAPTLAALATLVVGIRNSRKIEHVHRTVNSRLDQLVALTRVEAHAAGVKEEKDRRGGAGELS